MELCNKDSIIHTSYRADVRIDVTAKNLCQYLSGFIKAWWRGDKEFTMIFYGRDTHRMFIDGKEVDTHMRLIDHKQQSE